MFRVGIGFDIHRLAEGTPLILGGVTIPFPKGLEGHSDADVLVHALMDAMLGGAGLRDIGYYFPPDEPRYRNISSLKLLHEVKKMVNNESYRVVNADIVVIAEAPLLAPFIGEMKKNMAPVLELPESALSVKATTTEGLGACGRGEAIAAHAAVLLQANHGDK
ncbi:MAG TPA: 2-C-methyl-D-erythritol 2,4-cyclodiphosphate synthase [Bacillota bacterium]|nr:2-C-methyl-D-erythritol 2,4-cyclodiphosphate synthase [Bacillota bacterium]HOL15674.1 2-C-methyl-D-erythritol 2,4-cyclodiphosphate synthase [Bacillota bacterium]